MKAKRFKEILENIDDDMEIFIRNSVNPLGNISSLDQAESSSYGFFGESIPCLILNTDASKEIEANKHGEYIDFIISED